MQVGQTSCCITWNDYLPSLSTRRHLVLARLPTTNGLGHFVALLLVLNPVVDSGHFLPSENIRKNPKKVAHIWRLLHLFGLALPTPLLNVLANSFWNLAGPGLIHSLKIKDMGKITTVLHMDTVWHKYTNTNT